MPAIDIQRASLPDLDGLGILFDAYRVFYGQPSDLATARRFLDERLRRDESVILIARGEDSRQMSGFVQLYRMFSSVAARRIWILNDLFVTPAARRRGVARALLRAARYHAGATGAACLVLETAQDNFPAQQLYASEGWVREEGFHYRLDLYP